MLLTLKPKDAQTNISMPPKDQTVNQKLLIQPNASRNHSMIAQKTTSI